MFPFKRISLEEKMFLARYLALILKAGLPITRGFELLIKQSKNKYLKKVLENILNDINSGKPISESMSKYPEAFDSLFVHMIQAGEASGNLEEILETLAEDLKKSVGFRSKIISAIIYPSIIVAMMIIVTNFMVFFVFPKILKFYASLNVKVPMTAQILIFVVKFSIENILYILGGLIILIIFFIFWAKTFHGKKFIDWLIIKTPFLKSISTKIYSVQFVRTFSSLLKSGIPMPKALEITASTLNSFYYQNSITLLAEGVRQGKKISLMLENYKNLYPSIMAEIFNIGEETGQLAYLLKQLSEFMEAEVNNVLDNLSKIIEPVLMVVLAIVVGFVAIATVQLIYASIQVVQS
ncbi:MAG: type II secretion system F family protein [Minisyncoccia bacterium]